MYQRGKVYAIICEKLTDDISVQLANQLLRKDWQNMLQILNVGKKEKNDMLCRMTS